MKKKWLIGLMALCLSCATIGFVGCGDVADGTTDNSANTEQSGGTTTPETPDNGEDGGTTTPETPDDGEKSEIEIVYAQYVVYAEKNGETPLSYEEWLASIKGEKGEDGKSAYQIWLDSGHTGDEQDFLDWLKGLNDHNFGNWQAFTEGTVPCEQRMFYRVCADCNIIEWKKGSANDHNWNTVTTAPTCQGQGYDTKTCTICGEKVVENYTGKVGHAWGTEYSYDNSYHWYDCGTCTDVNERVEHTPDDTGECTVCKALVGETEGVLYDMSADGTYAEVIGYEGTATRVRIANTYNNVPVTKIYDSAFEYKGITSVIIPDSVTSIGYRAFYYCRSLTSIVIGDSVTSIGEKAFYDCGLMSVVIGDSVTSIGEKAFSWCGSLTSVVIGNSVESIGSEAFLLCRSLTKVNYTGTIDGWAQISFGDVNANPLYYAKKLYINDVLVTEAKLTTATKISNYAFFDCDSLTSVEIGDSVTSIGDWAFSDCDSLQFNEYGNCKYLGNKDNAYYALIVATNTNYSNYTIHEETKIIADEAFSGCSRMGSIVIPDSVTSIGSSAFSSCDSLTNIYYKGTASDWKKISVGDYNAKLTGATRYYYVENEADVSDDGDNYWHYDEKGNVAVW